MIKMYTFLQLQQQQVENLTLENDKNQYDNKLFLRKKMEREQKRKDKSYYIFNTKIMKKQKNDK